MATFTKLTVDGSFSEKLVVPQTGLITNQSSLNGEVIFSMLNHGLTPNQPIVFTASTGTNLGGNALLPANLTAGTTYYVKEGWTGGSSYFILTGIANNFQVSATPGGANIAWGSGFQGVVSSPGHAWISPLASGTNITVDLNKGTFFEIDLENTTGNITTCTVNNASATHMSSFVLKITQGSTARQLVIGGPGSPFEWAGGGTIPVLTTTNNAVDILSFTTYDFGTTWHGTVVGQNYS